MIKYKIRFYKLAATNHFSEVTRIPARGITLIVAGSMLGFLLVMVALDQFQPIWHRNSQVSQIHALVEFGRDTKSLTQEK